MPLRSRNTKRLEARPRSTRTDDDVRWPSSRPRSWQHRPTPGATRVRCRSAREPAASAAFDLDVSSTGGRVEERAGVAVIRGVDEVRELGGAR
ncbi:MAG: hypothetical protein ABTS22_22375 [Accumulibacter sp.]|uniref:hypothetical protein n=1 Tax=Accumulibacter sp. TaxID=2053492 RepID=UPI003315AB10